MNLNKFIILAIFAYYVTSIDAFITIFNSNKYVQFKVHLQYKTQGALQSNARLKDYVILKQCPNLWSYRLCIL